MSLGKERIVQKNWEGVTEKIEGKLYKWKWLLAQMSFKGRVLVLNNLVASQLWHRLTCVDPPPNLLAQLQLWPAAFSDMQITWGWMLLCFLIDSKLLKCRGLPLFYQGVFKS